MLTLFYLIDQVELLDAGSASSNRGGAAGPSGGVVMDDGAGPAPVFSRSEHTLAVTCLICGLGGAGALVASGSLDRSVKRWCAPALLVAAFFYSKCTQLLNSCVTLPQHACPLPFPARSRALADGAVLATVRLPTYVLCVLFDAAEQAVLAVGLPCQLFTSESRTWTAEDPIASRTLTTSVHTPCFVVRVGETAASSAWGSRWHRPPAAPGSIRESDQRGTGHLQAGIWAR